MRRRRVPTGAGRRPPPLPRGSTTPRRISLWTCAVSAASAAGRLSPMPRLGRPSYWSARCSTTGSRSSCLAAAAGAASRRSTSAVERPWPSRCRTRSLSSGPPALPKCGRGRWRRETRTGCPVLCPNSFCVTHTQYAAREVGLGGGGGSAMQQIGKCVGIVGIVRAPRYSRGAQTLPPFYPFASYILPVDIFETLSPTSN